MSHSPTCRGCAALTARTRHWRTTGRLTEQDVDNFQEEHTVIDESAAPPDPYEKELKQLRAASATPESTFEDRWKADRLRALDAEGARLAAHIEAHPFPRVTAAEAEDYAAPDPYAAGIKALQEKETR